MNSIKYNKET